MCIWLQWPFQNCMLSIFFAIEFPIGIYRRSSLEGQGPPNAYIGAAPPAPPPLKSVATLQYKPEGPHMLFYMTTTKANLVWEQEHTHARQAQIASQLNNPYTVKRFGLLQPYFGHLSCMPVVCVTHYKTSASYRIKA